MKKSTPMFTICIPVYKSEPYISYAIQDILDQTFSDFECLVIDDKSPDNAMAVAKKMTKGDDRFIFMKNKTNKGVSATRNRGIKKAQGEYILFLDSDDRFDVNLLKRISDQILSAGEEPDIVTWEFGQLGTDNRKLKEMEGWRIDIIKKYKKSVGTYNPASVGNEIFQLNTGHMCVKAFNIKYLNGISHKFDTSIRFSEDSLFSYVAICLAECVEAITGDNILYFYRRDQPNSAMHTIDLSNQMNDQLKVIDKLSKTLKEHGVYDKYEQSFERWVQDSVGSILHRITREYINRRTMLDEQIFGILRSRSWRLTGMLRKIK